IINTTIATIAASTAHVKNKKLRLIICIIVSISVTGVRRRSQCRFSTSSRLPRLRSQNRESSPSTSHLVHSQTDHRQLSRHAIHEVLKRTDACLLHYRRMVEVSLTR